MECFQVNMDIILMDINNKEVMEANNKGRDLNKVDKEFQQKNPQSLNYPLFLHNLQ